MFESATYHRFSMHNIKAVYKFKNIIKGDNENSSALYKDCAGDAAPLFAFFMINNNKFDSNNPKDAVIFIRAYNEENFDISLNNGTIISLGISDIDNEYLKSIKFIIKKKDKNNTVHYFTNELDSSKEGARFISEHYTRYTAFLVNLNREYQMMLKDENTPIDIEFEVIYETKKPIDDYLIEKKEDKNENLHYRRDQ